MKLITSKVPSIFDIASDYGSVVHMWFYASSGWDSDVFFAIWKRFMMLMAKLKVFHLFLLVLESHSSALLMGAFAEKVRIATRVTVISI